MKELFLIAVIGICGALFLDSWTTNPLVVVLSNKKVSSWKSVTLTFYSNGGNTTGPQPITLFSNSSLLNAIEEASSLLGLSEAKRSGARLYDAFGKLITSKANLQENQNVYIVPKDEYFIWPAPYVGYKVQVQIKQNNYTLEVLSLRPRLFKIENWVSDSEIEQLIAAASAKMFDSKVMDQNVDNKGEGKADRARVSRQAWLPHNTNQATVELDERVAELIHVPRYLQLEDDIQVLNYQPGGHYWAHYDSVLPEMAGNNEAILAGVQRLATFFFYLNDVESGGETGFPKVGPTAWKESEVMDYTTCSRGMKVPPKKGTAILWYNLLAESHMEGETDRYAIHSGCDVLKGEKWAANKWIYNKRHNGRLWI